MSAVLGQLGKGAHVAIIRLRSLGDCVLTTSAITLLKRQRHDLRVAVVVEPRFAPVFENNPDVTDIIEPSFRAVYEYVPELVINFHGGSRSMLLSRFNKAPFRAGFRHHRYSGWIYNVRIPRAQEILGVDRKVHTAEHLASAMFYLGVPKQPIPRARLYAKPVTSTFPYVVIHAQASSPDKTWPAERFIEVAQKLRSEWALEPIFIGTPDEDLTAFKEFRTHSGSLSDTKALLAGASLFVGNDSGPAHMAAAFQVPLVVLFGASDPVIWAPWQADAETIVAKEGMSSVPVKRVFDALSKLRQRSFADRLRARA